MNELEHSAVLRKLRPPYGQAAQVLYSFSATPPVNLGLTLGVPIGAPLMAAGDGVVDLISPVGARWKNTLGPSRMNAVRIDHGRGIKTWVHGLGAINVGYGPVTRGQVLGLAALGQVFFGFEQDGKLLNPIRINPHFAIQDGYLSPAEQQALRPAPDLVTRTLTTIASLLGTGITYLLPGAPDAVRFNLDFNGDGTKTGAAVTGVAGDRWQSIFPLDFAGTVGYAVCPGSQQFPAAQGLFLEDYAGRSTRVYLQRTTLTAAAGSGTFFDPMLCTWMGGYTGLVPKLNSFTIRNLPRGTYRLYVYANGGPSSPATTTVYCAVDGGAPTNQAMVPTATLAWLANENYVKFDGLVVANKGQVSVSVYGYLAGLQLERTSA